MRTEAEAYDDNGSATMDVQGWYEAAEAHFMDDIDIELIAYHSIGLTEDELRALVKRAYSAGFNSGVSAVYNVGDEIDYSKPHRKEWDDESAGYCCPTDENHI
jgi:hypothetical protein